MSVWWWSLPLWRRLAVVAPSNSQTKSFRKFREFFFEICWSALVKFRRPISLEFALCQSAKSPQCLSSKPSSRFSSLDKPFHKPRQTIPVTTDYVYVYVYICAWMGCFNTLRFVLQNDLHSITAVHYCDYCSLLSAFAKESACFCPQTRQWASRDPLHCNLHGACLPRFGIWDVTGVHLRPETWGHKDNQRTGRPPRLSHSPWGLPWEEFWMCFDL